MIDNLNTGIYKILNKVTKKIYIGSTKTSFILRWRDHKKNLRKNKHVNKKLQNSWNLYGEEAFEFEVVEKIASDISYINFYAREQYWMDKLDTVKSGYNIYPDARGSHGSKHTEESKIKQSTIKKLMWKNTEYREKCMLAMQGRRYGGTHPQSVLTEDQVRQIKQSLSEKVSCVKLSRQFNVSKHTILEIKHERIWKWVIQ